MGVVIVCPRSERGICCESRNVAAARNSRSLCAFGMTTLLILAWFSCIGALVLAVGPKFFPLARTASTLSAASCIKVE